MTALMITDLSLSEALGSKALSATRGGFIIEPQPITVDPLPGFPGFPIEIPRPVLPILPITQPGIHPDGGGVAMPL